MQRMLCVTQWCSNDVHLPNSTALRCRCHCFRFRHLFPNAAAVTTAASAGSNPQQQQQQRIFAVAGIDDLTFAEPAALPAECSSSGSCGPQLYGMRLSRIEALWGDELKDIIPLAEFPYRGTIVDDGVDFNHGNLRGQVRDSVTQSSNQAVAAAAAGQRCITCCALHGSIHNLRSGQGRSHTHRTVWEDHLKRVGDCLPLPLLLLLLLQVDVGDSATCSLDSGDPQTQGMSDVTCPGSSVAAMQLCDGHGTLVAGIMAGAWSNGDRGGIAGGWMVA
jgi:hypothetical protein